jgi:hypothetical protein
MCFLSAREFRLLHFSFLLLVKLEHHKEAKPPKRFLSLLTKAGTDGVFTSFAVKVRGQKNLFSLRLKEKISVPFHSTKQQ